MLIVESVQLLLGRGLRSPDPTQHHLDQLIASAHACLAQQGEQQRMPLARLRDGKKVAHFQGRGFRGELAELGMGDALQKRIGIDHAGDPVEPIDPQPDRLGCRGSGGLLEAIETGCRAVGWLDQQGIQDRSMPDRQTRGHPIVDPPMDFTAQPVHQPVERAERRKIDRRRVQHLDRSIDEICRIAHGLCGLERGAGDQLLARLGKCGDAEMRPDGRLVAVQRLRLARLVGWDRQNGHVHLRSQIRRGVRVDFARRDEIAEVLAGLQQSCQQHAAGIASGGGADEREIRVAQAVSGAQLFSGQPRAWPRVGSAVDGGHRGVRKRVRRSG